MKRCEHFNVPFKLVDKNENQKIHGLLLEM